MNTTIYTKFYSAIDNAWKNISFMYYISMYFRGAFIAIGNDYFVFKYLNILLPMSLLTYSSKIKIKIPRRLE